MTTFGIPGETFFVCSYTDLNTDCIVIFESKKNQTSRIVQEIGDIFGDRPGMVRKWSVKLIE